MSELSNNSLTNVNITKTVCGDISSVQIKTTEDKLERYVGEYERAYSASQNWQVPFGVMITIITTIFTTNIYTIVHAILRSGCDSALKIDGKEVPVIDIIRSVLFCISFILVLVWFLYAVYKRFKNKDAASSKKLMEKIKGLK